MTTASYSINTDNSLPSTNFPSSAVTVFLVHNGKPNQILKTRVRYTRFSFQQLLFFVFFLNFQMAPISSYNKLCSSDLFQYRSAQSLAQQIISSR